MHVREFLRRVLYLYIIYNSMRFVMIHLPMHDVTQSFNPFTFYEQYIL